MRKKQERGDKETIVERRGGNKTVQRNYVWTVEEGEMRNHTCSSYSRLNGY